MAYDVAMGGWKDLPRGRLLADVSLWSADLANLEREMAGIGGMADSFHFDVADAHFAPSLLFFPDLVRRLRPLTAVPFHVHLMVEAPMGLLDDFLAAGADLVTVHVEIGEGEVLRALVATGEAGRSRGIALKLETPVEAAAPYLDGIDTVLLLGTAIGVKGQDLAPGACDHIRQMKRLLGEQGRPEVRIIADGGIRSHTVPLLREAGADAVVPGSLVFSNDRPADVLGRLRAMV
jgi:ribulose-phosphate 3-epimerase